MKRAPLGVRSYLISTRASSAAVLLLSLAACKGARHPRVPAAGSETIDLGRSGLSLRAATGDGTHTYVALGPATATETPTSMIEARTGTHVDWTSKVTGDASVLVAAGDLVAVAVAGRGEHVGSSAPYPKPLDKELVVRGDPGAVLTALDRATGAVRFRVPVDGSEWSLVTSIATLGNDVVIAGSFAGSLRVANSVVTSAGGSDGFVARIRNDGQVMWLERMGGAGADAVQGVATNGQDRIAIAGTFTAGADILGEPLKPYDERLPYADAFVAELDGNGARRWSQTFGGKGDESIAGVAIDARGDVIAAGSAREIVYIGGIQLDTQGEGDGVVVRYHEKGELGPAILLGGFDFDGLRAIAAVDDRVVVGGFFSGQMKLGERTLTAGGGDDAYIAELDPNGTVVTSWQITGEGREEIASLSAIRGGFIAGVAHTATAKIDDETLPSPSDPVTGAALIIRGL
ncbi:MAG TPA: hypothetical protein VLB44_07945 [Kofleriaceae bacterium]|nr:hypothetical protein [Kofleriaceae bacterium]